MIETITKTYASVDALKNVKEDLVATGIEKEHILLNKDKKQVKVKITNAAEPEILEILNRHSPID